MPGLSADAAFVLALAHHALPHADSCAAQAERWLRILRVYGHAGCALQSLGVGEGPLKDSAPGRPAAGLRQSFDPTEAVRLVERRARRLAREQGSGVVSTVQLTLAVAEVYGNTLERALRLRGTSWEELLERLPLRAVAA